MDLQRARGPALVLGALVVGPLFGAVVDVLYLVILMLNLGQLRWTRSVSISALVCLGIAALLAVANPHVQAPFFSYFFGRLALLLLLFGGTPSLWREPDPALLYGLFAIYVGAAVYQYLGLPGSEALQALHAEKIVDEGVGYRASGLFSGFFSAATVIGSLGIVLLLRTALVVTPDAHVAFVLSGHRQLSIYDLAQLPSPSHRVEHVGDICFDGGDSVLAIRDRRVVRIGAAATISSPLQGIGVASV